MRASVVELLALWLAHGLEVDAVRQALVEQCDHFRTGRGRKVVLRTGEPCLIRNKRSGDSWGRHVSCSESGYSGACSPRPRVLGALTTMHMGRSRVIPLHEGMYATPCSLANATLGDLAMAPTCLNHCVPRRASRGR